MVQTRTIFELEVNVYLRLFFVNCDFVNLPNNSDSYWEAITLFWKTMVDGNED